MSVLLEAVHPFIVAGLLGVEGPATTTFEDMLNRGGCIPSYDGPTKSWTLDFRDQSLVSKMQAYECSRMACAAMQSYSNVEQDLGDVNRLPWALVCAYYAGYYSAHCIVRAMGSGCSYLDRGRVDTLRQLLNVYGVTDTPEKGLYVVSPSSSGAELCLDKIGGKQGGSHDAFWAMFGKRMKRLEEDVMLGALPQTDAQAVFLQLAKLRSILGRQAKPFNWLSEMRNAVQYRHQHGAWFPAKPNAKQRGAMARIASAARKDPMIMSLDPSDEIQDFLSGVTFLVAFCRELIAVIGKRSVSGRSFVEAGPLKYLRQRAG